MFKKISGISNYYKSILCLGVVTSILWILIVDTKPFSDFQYYNNLAQQIANGGLWGDTYTSVGYPIVLGFLYKIFGANLWVGKIFNVLLYALNGLLFLGILRKQKKLSETSKQVIFTCFIFFPNTIFYNSILCTEILFSTLLLSTTYVYFSSIRYKYIWIGVLVAATSMVKPFFMAFFFVVFIVEGLCEKKWVFALKNALTILLVSILCLSPWFVRNSMLTGQPTYISNNGGIVLYINNNSQNKSGRWMAADDVENSLVKQQSYLAVNMTEKNKILGKEAKKWIISHPKEFVVLGFKRLHNTYFWGDDITYSTYGSFLDSEQKSTIFSLTNSVRNIVFMPAILYIILLSFIYIYGIWKKQKFDIFETYLLVLFYMFTSIYFITEGQGRYAFPVIFILIYYFYKILEFINCKRKEIKL